MRDRLFISILALAVGALSGCAADGTSVVGEPGPEGGAAGFDGSSGAGGTSSTGGQACALGVGGNAARGNVRALSPELIEPSTCSPRSDGGTERADECGCNGLTCDAGQTCVRVTEPAPSAIGGPDTLFNGCFPLCQDDSDCNAPTVCIRNLYGLDVCSAVACRTDADCTADACGACVGGIFNGHGVSLADPSSSSCAYAGPCGATSCSGCVSGDERHTCPDSMP